MLPTVIDDLVAINDTLRDMGGGLTGDDPSVVQSGLGNFFTGFLEFIKTALVPTQQLNLEGLQTMPDNLNEKIPFCLAGDLVRVFTVFQADPVAPEIHIPFDTSFIGGSQQDLVLDFSAFDEWAPTFRNLSFASFLIGLIWMTVKMLFGGGGEA